MRESGVMGCAGVRGGGRVRICVDEYTRFGCKGRVVRL